MSYLLNFTAAKGIISLTTLSRWGHGIKEAKLLGQGSTDNRFWSQTWETGKSAPELMVWHTGCIVSLHCFLFISVQKCSYLLLLKTLRGPNFELEVQRDPKINILKSKENKAAKHHFLTLVSFKYLALVSIKKAQKSSYFVDSLSCLSFKMWLKFN